MIEAHEIKHKALLKAVLFFGSRRALAQSLSVSPQVINNWLNRGDNVPYEYAILIEDITRGLIKIEELAPASPVNKIIRKYIGVIAC